jgi:hypothetical protein
MKIDNTNLDPAYLAALRKADSKDHGGDGNGEINNDQELKKALSFVLEGKKVSELPKRYQNMLQTFVTNYDDTIDTTDEIKTVITIIEGQFANEKKSLEDFFYKDKSLGQRIVENVAPKSLSIQGTAGLSGQTPDDNDAIAKATASTVIRTNGGITGAVKIDAPVPLTPDGIINLAPDIDWGLGYTAADGKSGVWLGVASQSDDGIRKIAMPEVLQSYTKGTALEYLNNEQDAVPMALAWYTVKDDTGQDRFFIQIFGGASPSGHNEDYNFYEDLFQNHAFSAGSDIEVRITKSNIIENKAVAGYMFESYPVVGSDPNNPDTVKSSSFKLGWIQEIKLGHNHRITWNTGATVTASTHSALPQAGSVTRPLDVNDPFFWREDGSPAPVTNDATGNPQMTVDGVTTGPGAGDYTVRVPFSLKWNGDNLFGIGGKQISLAASIDGYLDFTKLAETAEEKRWTDPDTSNPMGRIDRHGGNWENPGLNISANSRIEVDISKGQDKSVSVYVGGGVGFDSKKQENTGNGFVPKAAAGLKISF